VLCLLAVAQMFRANFLHTLALVLSSRRSTILFVTSRTYVRLYSSGFLIAKPRDLKASRVLAFLVKEASVASNFLSLS
jgi:hypothetical protein